MKNEFVPWILGQESVRGGHAQVMAVGNQCLKYEKFGVPDLLIRVRVLTDETSGKRVLLLKNLSPSTNRHHTTLIHARSRLLSIVSYPLEDDLQLYTTEEQK